MHLNKEVEKSVTLQLDYVHYPASCDKSEKLHSVGLVRTGLANLHVYNLQQYSVCVVSGPYKVPTVSVHQLFLHCSQNIGRR